MGEQSQSQSGESSVRARSARVFAETAWGVPQSAARGPRDIANCAASEQRSLLAQLHGAGRGPVLMRTRRTPYATIAA
eukprot:4123871-Alexandrium_andersonii.AAC.1